MPAETCLACRNILKTNDVRTGLKKPEQAPNKRVASSEPAQLAEAAKAADVARADPAQAADMSTADRQTHNSSAAANGGGGAHAAPSEWEVAKAARDRCATVLPHLPTPPPPPFPLPLSPFVQTLASAYTLLDIGVMLLADVAVVLCA